MIRHQFPDLQWLKQRVVQFEQTRQGWPSVVLNVKAAHDYRPNIKGPLSLFLNVKGQSRCGTSSGLNVIGEEHFYLTNAGEHYTLEVEETAGTETLNIHFGERFMEEVYQGLATPADQLLAGADPASASPVHFFSRLYPRDAVFNQLAAQLHRHSQGPANELLLQEQLYNLLVYLLQRHREVLKEVAKLPQVRQATRTELYKRLSRAHDYLHTHYHSAIKLEELAEEAALSKYHFLRLFRQAFGQSPYQRVQELRVEAARQLLRHTQLPVSDIAVRLGFENLSSFSRLFYQRTKAWPQQYRVQR